jgi:predicted nuclease of predicted toxin-antitoxin system
MKIFVDENIPIMTVEALRNMGHDVVDIRGTEKEGIEDIEIWELVLKEKRLIITTDKSFIKRHNKLHSGILVIRLRQPNLLKIHERVMKAMKQFNSEEWSGLLVVMRDVVQSIRR